MDVQPPKELMCSKQTMMKKFTEETEQDVSDVDADEVFKPSETENVPVEKKENVESALKRKGPKGCVTHIPRKIGKPTTEIED